MILFYTLLIHKRLDRFSFSSKSQATLYQQLTSLMFIEEIHKITKTKSSSRSADSIEPLSDDEGNALHYTADISVAIFGNNWNVEAMS